MTVVLHAGSSAFSLTGYGTRSSSRSTSERSVSRTLTAAHSAAFEKSRRRSFSSVVCARPAVAFATVALIM